MERENAIIHVTKFLTLKDMLNVTSSCLFLNLNDDIWNHFFFEYKSKLCNKEKIFMEKLKFAFYGNTKRTVISYHIKNMWSRWSITDQMQCYSTKKIILLYFIAMVLQNGKKILYTYNKYMDQLNIKNKYMKSKKIRWSLSTWEILRGSRRNVFRRKYLSVY